jgi:uncharacterized membrane protein
MPEFTKDIIDLNELNRKVEQRRKEKESAERKKLAARQRLALRVLIYELLIVLAAGVAAALRLNGVISHAASVILLTLCVVFATYIAGWHAGYRRAFYV